MFLSVAVLWALRSGIEGQQDPASGKTCIQREHFVFMPTVNLVCCVVPGWPSG